MRWPAAQVTGIDFSATSVRCTEELKRKYQLNNLQVRQLPIERVGELETSFDQIVCTGVLHHLADPDAGLRALRGVLKPGGAMHLMVYAPYGRTGIYMLQEFCRRIGIHANDEGIRDLIAALTALPPGHPLENLLREAPDFRQEAALADALLHPQDRAYSVPQLFEFHRRGRTDIRPVVKAGTLQPSLRCHGKDPAGFPDGTAFRWQSSMPPSNCFAARWFATAWLRTETTALAARNRSVLPVTPGLAMCRFACQTRSVFKSGCRPARRRC